MEDHTRIQPVFRWERHYDRETKRDLRALYDDYRDVHHDYYGTFDDLYLFVSKRCLKPIGVARLSLDSKGLWIECDRLRDISS